MLCSCSALVSDQTNKKVISSSLTSYLYPENAEPPAQQPEIPVLKLPANVGVAFIPSGNQMSHRDQIALLEKVKAEFIGYDYINNIEIIPSTYLNREGGFNALEQVGRLYNVDIMALVSFDQVSQSYENNAALLYWTIVGMYIIPGNENSVQTFVDTAVFDIKSRKLLFRAPGINKIEKMSTAIGVDETLDEKSFEGFEAAVEDMTANLNAELDGFKTRVKEEKVAKVEYKKNYSGSSTGPLALLLLLVVSVFRRKFFR